MAAVSRKDRKKINEPNAEDPSFAYSGDLEKKWIKRKGSPLIDQEMAVCLTQCPFQQQPKKGQYNADPQKKETNGSSADDAEQITDLAVPQKFGLFHLVFFDKIGDDQ